MSTSGHATGVIPSRLARRTSNETAHAVDGETSDKPQALQHDNQVIELSRPQSPEEQVRKCWICFEEESETEISNNKNESGWRRPCQCTLAAHEECLLTWVDETQKSSTTGMNTLRPVKCPQCKQPYRIRSQNSLGVNLMTIADGWIGKALLATIPLGIIKSLGITCFYYGQGAILDVLGDDRLTKIIMSLKKGDEIRYIIGASIIPFALVGARFDIFNFVLPLIPSLVCFSDTSFIQSKLPLDSSPALWICVLPWLRNIYCLGWRLLLGNQEQKWKEEAGLLKPNVTELAPGIGIRDIPAQPAENNEDAANQEDDAIAERWIFVEAPRLARLIAGALLLPKIAVMAGNLLARSNTFKKRYPHRFQRVLIGGASFVVIKDIFSILYLYSRAKGRSTRHIQNRPVSTSRK